VLIAAMGLSGDFWLQKRRDDVFAKSVDRSESTIGILQAVIICEAVRSLSPQLEITPDSTDQRVYTEIGDTVYRSAART
jgi:hypothetical protein